MARPPKLNLPLRDGVAASALACPGGPWPLVLDFLAERLPLDVQPRQELLEARTTFERLMRELPLLRHELERADGLLAQRNWLASLVLN